MNCLIPSKETLQISPNNTCSEPLISARRQTSNLLSLFSSAKLKRPNALQGNYTSNKPRCQIRSHIVTDKPYIPASTEVKLHPLILLATARTWST